MFKSLAKGCLVPIYAAQQWMRPCKYLFLVGHMRSGSSLLTHILDTNPEITSYGETHLRYHCKEDVDRLVNDVFPTLRRIRLTRYVMDKVVQEHHLCREVFQREDCYFIFLVREPDASVRSMLRAFPTWKGKEHLDRDTAMEKAISHYNSRLCSIKSNLEVVGDSGRGIFLRHTDLIEHTTKSFEAIARILALETPLSEEYDLSRTTGEPGKGDPSENIRKGHIDRKINHDDDPIDHKLLAESTRLYSNLIRQAESLGTSVE